MIYYITSEVVVKLSISKDSFLVMESTEVRAAKDETATQDGGVADMKENVAPNSAEKYEPSLAQPELKRIIYMLTMDQFLEAQLDQEMFMMI